MNLDGCVAVLGAGEGMLPASYPLFLHKSLSNSPSSGPGQFSNCCF